MQSIVLSVAKQFRIMNKQMRFIAILAFSAGSIFSGCRTAHDVAVTSFRVIDAPAAYIRRHVDESDTTTTTTTTTTTADSDVVAPGRVINSAPSSTENRTVSQSRPRSTSNAPSRSSPTETVTAKPKPSPSRSPARDHEPARFAGANRQAGPGKTRLCLSVRLIQTADMWM